jgi:hypothetical protein
MPCHFVNREGFDTVLDERGVGEGLESVSGGSYVAESLTY